MIHRALRPVGSLTATVLAVTASALPLTADGLGSATPSATALGLAWDSGRTQLRIAAFVGAALLLAATAATVVSVMPGDWARRLWLSLVAMFVLAMLALVLALRGNAGAAVAVLGVSAVVLGTTGVIDSSITSRRKQRQGAAT